MIAEVREISILPVHNDSLMFFKKVIKISKVLDNYFVKLCVEVYDYRKKSDRFELCATHDVHQCHIDILTQDKHAFGRYILDSSTPKSRYLFDDVPQMFWTIDDMVMKEIVDAVVEDCEKEEATV